MNEHLKNFLNQLSADPVLQKKITEQTSMEDAYSVAAEVMTGFTLQEFTIAFDSYLQDMGGLLPDDDLIEVAGGSMPPIGYGDFVKGEIL